MALYRFFFLNMFFRYVQGARDANTRLYYALPGPLLVIAAFVLVFQRVAPSLAVALFLAGSSMMRIQASMVEWFPWKSLRNGALLITAFMALFIAMGDYVWAPIGLALAAGLFVMHRHHEQELKRRKYSQGIDAMLAVKSQMDR